MSPVRQRKIRQSLSRKTRSSSYENKIIELSWESEIQRQILRGQKQVGCYMVQFFLTEFENQINANPAIRVPCDLG